MAIPYRILQANFNGGEISPLMLGRSDLAVNAKSLRSSVNMLPYVQGGIGRRTGTYFVGSVKTPANYTRLVRFQFSTIQQYALEFGNQYFRIYRNRGRVESPPGTPVEVVTPYTTADLVQLKFTQSADTLYIFHPSYQTRKVTRTSDTSWTITTVAWKDGPWGPVNTTATTLQPSAASGTITITASAATFAATDVGRLVRIRNGGPNTWGSATITAFTNSTTVTATVNENFAGTTASSTWRLGALSDTTGYASCGVFHQQRLFVAGTTSQPQTIWGSVTADFENFRPTQPDNSVNDDDGFSFTLATDKVDAIHWLTSYKVLLIGTEGGVHTLSGGNNSAYQPITPSNASVRLENAFGVADSVRPAVVGNSVLYIQRDNQVVRELLYDIGIDGYVSTPVNLVAEHITQPSITDFDFQFARQQVGWMVRSDGVLISMLYERSQQVAGYVRHTIGGGGAVESLVVLDTPGGLSSDVWCIVRRGSRRDIEYIGDDFQPQFNGQASALHFDSALTYDGYYDATLTPGATSGTGVTFTASSSVFTASDVGAEIRSGDGVAVITAQAGTTATANITSDFASTSAIASGSWSVARNSFSGASHLASQSCGVIGDGASLPNVTVSGSGTFSTERKYSKLHVGYTYTSSISLLPLESQPTTQGMFRRTSRLYFRVQNSLGLKVRMSDGFVDTLIRRTSGDAMGIAPPLFTGIVDKDYGGNYDKEQTIEIFQDDGQPLTILFVVQEGSYGG